MKDGMVIMLRPFTTSQKVIVYKNGNSIYEKDIPYNSDFPTFISEKVFEFSLTDIYISGPKTYGQGLASVIKNKLLYTYKKDNINFKFLSKGE